MSEVEVGRVSQFFARPVVAGVALTAPLKVGDRIHIKGHTTDIQMVVESMQIDNKNVEQGNAGDLVGIKITDRARPDDKVYVVTE